MTPQTCFCRAGVTRAVLKLHSGCAIPARCQIFLLTDCASCLQGAPKRDNFGGGGGGGGRRGGGGGGRYNDDGYGGGGGGYGVLPAPLAFLCPVGRLLGRPPSRLCMVPVTSKSDALFELTVVYVHCRTATERSSPDTVFRCHADSGLLDVWTSVAAGIRCQPLRVVGFRQSNAALLFSFRRFDARSSSRVERTARDSTLQCLLKC